MPNPYRERDMWAVDVASGISTNTYRPSRYSSRDEYIMRRYQDLMSMAQDIAHGRDLPEVITGLAIIDLTIELRDLPRNMPKVTIPENKLDVRIVSDHINAAMSELYK